MELAGLPDMALSEEATAEKIAGRLSIVREVTGLTQTEFARRAGLGVAAWNNYEAARKRISIDAAIALCEVYKLTLDYIYVGDTSNLPYHLAAAIESVHKHRKTRKS